MRKRPLNPVPPIDPEVIIEVGAALPGIRRHHGEPAPYPATAPHARENLMAGAPVITPDGQVHQLTQEEAVDNQLRAYQALHPEAFAEAFTAVLGGYEKGWARTIRRSRGLPPLAPERKPRWPGDQPRTNH